MVLSFAPEPQERIANLVAETGIEELGYPD